MVARKAYQHLGVAASVCGGSEEEIMAALSVAQHQRNEEINSSSSGQTA